MRFGLATVRGQYKEKQGMRHRIPVARFPGNRNDENCRKLVVLAVSMPITFLTLTLSRRRAKTSPATIIRWRSVERAPGGGPPGAAERISRLSPAPAMTISVNASVVSWRAIKSTRAGARGCREVIGGVNFVNAEGENAHRYSCRRRCGVFRLPGRGGKERIASAQALLMQLELLLESVIAAAKIAHHHHTTVVQTRASA